MYNKLYKVRHTKVWEAIVDANGPEDAKRATHEWLTINDPDESYNMTTAVRVSHWNGKADEETPIDLWSEDFP